LGALRLADVGLDGVGQDKTTSILKCVEYSHSNLSESAQQLLLCLAPFSGFIWRDGIPLYAEELKKLEPFKDYDFAGFDDAIQEAINWGLLSPIDDSNDSLLSIQPVFPYFLQVRLNESTVEIQEALQEGFKSHYCNLADSYDQMLQSKDPQEKKWGIFLCRLEYENLYATLQTCLKKHESFTDAFYCLYTYFVAINDKQGRLKISEAISEALETYPTELIQGKLEYEAMNALHYLANAYLQTKQLDQAKHIYHKELETIAALKSIDTKQKGMFIAHTYHQLGRVAEELREWDDARHNYHQALAIKVEFGDRYSQACTYGQLGRVAEELREWDDARHNLHQALTIYVEFGDQYSQAIAHHQLGRVAEELREWDNARHHYHQALAISMELGDRYEQASTYHQLGRVAEELREWDDARHNYHQALAIKVEFGDRYEQASTYHQLGRVAQELREWDDACHSYHQALAISMELGDRYEQAIIYHQLGRVAQEFGEWDDARHNYHQALAIKVEFGDRYGQARTYHQMGVLAQELGELDDARHNYHQALAIEVEFGDRHKQAGTYVQLGLLAVAECDLEVATKNLLQALQIFVDFKDEHSMGIAIRNLGRIYQPSQSPEVITTIANICGFSEAEVQQIFDSMSQGT
jgi:tetratricopeptide (TPR) repeat protein